MLLPSSVRVNSSSPGIQGKAPLEVELSIDPVQFPTLLQGRSFTRMSGGMSYTHSTRISGYRGFPVAEGWQWDSKCQVYTNSGRTMVFIVYSGQ